MSDFQKIAVVVRNSSVDAQRTALELAEWLMRRKLSVSLDPETLKGVTTGRTKDPAMAKKLTVYRDGDACDLVIVLGGDGTLLSTARSVRSDVPILGVNLGRLGFLTELSRKELYPSLVRLLAGKYTLEERSLFDVELRPHRKKASHYRAFNDAVITKTTRAMVEIEIEVAGHLVARYRSDGLIISTPNGSTAYNLSAGGPILYPALPVAVLTPICPHSLSFRPIVVPDSTPIEIKLHNASDGANLSIDGQEGGPLGPRDKVVVQRAKTTVQLIRITDRTFYDNLRHKLSWGG